MKDTVILDGDFVLETVESGEFGVVTVINTEVDAYTGDYTIVPILNNDIIMATRGLLMTDNVTIKEIPIVYTSNPYNGKTVVIG